MNYLDKTGLTQVWTNLKSKLANKVDKVSGKGLSTNDFTTTLKNKLDNIEAGAQVNTVTGVKGSAESSYRISNVNITKSNIGLGNVENKSSSTIREEITELNVTTALGFTPADDNIVYIGDEADAPNTAKLVIDDEGEGIFSTEVVNSLEGSESTKAPSVVAVNQRFNYSTTEQKIGTWFDGKPLYRKVVILSQSISTSTTSENISLPFTNIENMWICNKSTFLNNNNLKLPFPFANPADIVGGGNNDVSGYIYISNGVPILRIRKSNEVAITIGTFVLEYTKTTD